ncbi:Fructose-bisphosphate aldolase, class-I [Dillenia turbinata]|uniref:fructose-bisphosphate aldolase n=1 Tax=Dillenia turbinata TaxID=194707 RepID=A0AAN8Z2V9_9MAGN
MDLSSLIKYSDFNNYQCQSLDGLASCSAAYYQKGARFAKWRTVLSIPNGPSAFAVKEAAWGLARYAAISQDNGLVPIVEPGSCLMVTMELIGLFEVAQKVRAEFLSGGQSEVEATLNLNAMNQGPNPWHMSFSYARVLQNTCLKKWGGRPGNVKEAQEALLFRARANSLAQLGKYTGEGE